MFKKRSVDILTDYGNRLSIKNLPCFIILSFRLILHDDGLMQILTIKVIFHHRFPIREVVRRELEHVTFKGNGGLHLHFFKDNGNLALIPAVGKIIQYR